MDREPGKTRTTWEDDPLYKVVRGHLALVTAVLLTTVTLLAVLLAARFSPTVALGLLATAGPTSVVSRLILVVFPVALFAAVTVSSLWLYDQRSRGRPVPVALAVTAAAGVLLLLFLPAWAFVAYGAILGIVVLVRRVFGSLKGRPMWLLLLPVFFALGLFSYDVWGAMWLPAERMELADGGTMVGYVLRESGGWVAVLLEEERLIVFVKPADITGREICRSYNRLEQTIPQLVTGSIPPTPPLCELP